MATREELLDMIPRERSLRAPAPVEPNFLRDTEVGRNLGNIVNATGASRAASGLLRGGSALDTLRAGSNAARVAQPVATGAAAAAALPTVASATDLRGAAVAPDQPRSSGMPDARGIVGPVVEQNPAGVVTRRGNSYSGTNIKEGFSFQDGRAAPGISVLDTSQGFRADQRALAELQANRPEPTPNGGLIFGGNASRLRSNEDFDKRQVFAQLESTARLGRGRERREAIKALAGLQQGESQNASGERVAQLRESGDMARSNAALQQRQREAEMTNERGLREADLGARVKMFDAQRDQANKDREFNFNKQKFGAEEANRIRDDRIKADDNLRSKLSTLFPGEDGKPDANRVASAFGMANDYIAGRIQDLEAVPASSSQYQAAQARAAELRRRGADVLDPRELQRVLEITKANDAKTETATGVLNPIGTAAGPNQGARGLEVREVRPGVFGIGEDVVLRDGSVIPMRYFKERGINLDALRDSQ